MTDSQIAPRFGRKRAWAWPAALAGMVACLLAANAPEAKAQAAATPAPAAKPIDSLKEQAAKGDAAAQFKLGMAYLSGQGVTQDPAQAAALWTQAATNGHVAAQFNLAVLHAQGKGVPQNYFEAAKFFRMAAEQKDKAAQYNDKR